MAAISIFCIVIIASNTRLRTAGSGSAIPSVSARGVITVEFPALEAARASLAGFGAALEVIDPPALRAEMARVAKELLGVYEKAPKSRAGSKS